VISVVVPAYDEADVIGRCLRTLLHGAAPGDFEVVVVCNGCTDDTAAVAKAVPGVTVLETPVAGKVGALRLGERQVTTFPRIFLDADVRLDGVSAHRLAVALEGGPALVAVPRPELDDSASSTLVRRFHRAWTALPAVRAQLGGAGAYALGAEGRRRLGELPEVLADDGYVLRAFAPEQRAVVERARTVVALPRDVLSLVRRRSRVHTGNRELAADTGLHQPVRTSPRVVAGLVRAGTVRPLDAAVLVGVTLAARVLAGWRRLRGADRTWSPDRSSRAAGGPV
jgi:glycosyltransferase involved in cell wall biosynthesis